MSAPRQQRRTQPGLQQQGAVNKTPPMISWDLITQGGPTAQFQMSDQISNLVLNGVPAVKNLTTGETADAINSISGNILQLRWPSSQPDGSEFEWPAYDPALRNRWGGWVNAGQQKIPVPPPVFPPTMDWDVFYIDDNNFRVSFAASAANVESIAIPVWGINGSYGSVVSTTRLSANEFSVNVSALVPVGTFLTMGGGGSSYWSTDGGIALQQTKQL